MVDLRELSLSQTQALKNADRAAQSDPSSHKSRLYIAASCLEMPWRAITKDTNSPRTTRNVG